MARKQAERLKKKKRNEKKYVMMKSRRAVFPLLRVLELITGS